jgi:hypothetical protein
MFKRKDWILGVCLGLLFLLAAGRPPANWRAAYQVALTATAIDASGDADSPTPSPTVMPTIASSGLLPQAKLLKLRLPVIGWLSTASREDWWAVAQKPDTWYYCEVDSNDFDPQMRVEVGGQVVTQSDDARPGTVKSTVSWTSGHVAWAYVVVSPAFRTGAYTLACSTGEPSPGATAPPSAEDVFATPSPTPTPTLVPIIWQSVATAPPAPVETQIDIKVFYDLNGSGAPDAAEGVAGVSVRVLDAANQFVGWAITDDQGEAQLTVTSPDVAQLYIPFFDWRQPVTPGQLNTVLVRVEPVSMPVVWPAR